MGFRRPLVQVQSLGPYTYNPNHIFQEEDGFGLFVLFERVESVSKKGNSKKSQYEEYSKCVDKDIHMCYVSY